VSHLGTRDHGSQAAVVVATLRDIVGADAVFTELADVEPFVVDWRGRYRGEALCVVAPRSTEDVARVVRACAAVGTPVVPQGGNTGLCGGSVPLVRSDDPARVGAVRAPVVLNLRRMNRILEVDTVGNTLVAEAGCVLADVQRAADERDRLYPVSLGAEGSCQIGGTISTNAGGTGVLRYGGTRENVLGLEVVLADGSIWNGLRGLRKDNTGYDLRALFVGAEGTLGVVTAATLRLHPKPRAFATAWCGVLEVGDALRLLEAVQSRAGSRLSAFELMNSAQARIVEKELPGRSCPLPSATPYHVLVEFSDTDESSPVGAQLEDALSRALEAGWITDAAVAMGMGQRAAIWEFRHSVSEANRKYGMGVTLDTGVPIGRIADFVAAASEATRQAFPDVEIVIVAHMGDGNVHFIPMFPAAVWEPMPDKPAVARRARQLVHDIAAQMHGTFSAEHGIGQTLADELVRLRSAEEIRLMRLVKDALDPGGLMNPGKVLPT
jgi:FAD/FMN-containing dehydrogenase